MVTPVTDVALSANALPFNVLTVNVLAVTPVTNKFLFKLAALTLPTVIRTTLPILMPPVSGLPVWNVITPVDATIVTAAAVNEEIATKSLRNTDCKKSLYVPGDNSPLNVPVTCFEPCLKSAIC